MGRGCAPLEGGVMPRLPLPGYSRAVRRWREEPIVADGHGETLPLPEVAVAEGALRCAPVEGESAGSCAGGRRLLAERQAESRGC